jgi:prophage regulatory protein
MIAPGGGGREPDRIIRRHQLRAVCGYSIGHVYELIKQGRFPRPVPLGPRAVGWLARDVEQWQCDRKAQRDSAGEAA